MKKGQLIILTLIATLFLGACKKQGCTDCNATNYNTEATEDDNSCQFLNEAHLGTYAVEDSITGPPTMDWNYNAYDIVLVRSNCAPNKLIISNYANKNNDFSGTIFNVECQVDNNTITISPQNVQGKSIRSTSGYFSTDSINFEIEYENELGEVFYGRCYGIKN